MAIIVELEETDLYFTWFDSLRDETTKARLRLRLTKIEETGDFGDIRGVGEGVYGEWSH